MMHFYIRLCAFTLLSTLYFSVAAQDARFSQFNQNPLHLNPALTGLYNGSIRLSANYRTLFYSVLNEEEYTSYSFSIENKFKIANNYLSIGAFVLQDEFGGSDYQRTYYNLSAAYHQRLSAGGRVGPDLFLVAGGQLGFGQYNFDPASLWFSNQYDNNLLEINRALDSREIFQEGASNRFMDINAGILFYGAYENGESFYFGGAIHHVSTPNVGLLVDSDETLYRRLTIHGGGELIIGDFSLFPAFFWRGQGPTGSATLGSSIGVDIDEEKYINVRIGAWGHLARRLDSTYQPESVIFTSSFAYKGWQLGFSYDMTVSTLERVNFSRGAFEISLIKITEEQYRSKVKCPRL